MWFAPVLVFVIRLIKSKKYIYVLTLSYVLIAALIIAGFDYFKMYNSFIFLPALIILWISSLVLPFVGNK